MKLVINRYYGGFGVNPVIAEKFCIEDNCTRDEKAPIRRNKKLIELIEAGVNCNDIAANLVVINIPDKATDWTIIDYDGAEDVIYVLDGKIHYACEEK